MSAATTERRAAPVRGLTPAGLVGVLVLALVLVPATPVVADSDDPAYGPAAAEAPALAALARAASAPRRVAYSGVQFLASWDGDASTSHLVDVTHVPGSGTAVQVRGSSTSPPQVAATLAEGSVDAGATTETLAVLARSYDLVLAGDASVAGRRATVVEVRRDDRTAAARFWVDDATGLLLRRELYEADGTPTQASAFVEVRVGGPRSLPVGVTPIQSMPHTRLTVDPTALRAAGWLCPSAKLGGLTLLGARRMATGQGAVLHVVYGDGVTRVSVFEQRGRLDMAAVDGWRTARVGDGVVYVRPGYPRRVVWAGGGSVFTVVADAPARATDAVVAGLPHEPSTPAPGMLDRVGRGADRVASWFTPFS